MERNDYHTNSVQIYQTSLMRTKSNRHSLNKFPRLLIYKMKVNVNECNIQICFFLKDVRTILSDNKIACIHIINLTCVIVKNN